MKLNRKLVMVLALVTSFALATGGTLAYLTDRDADVNVMTLGSVSIQQNEQERVEIGDAAQGLQAFTDGQTMLPGVYDLKDADGKPIADPAREVVDVNGYKVTLDGGMRTFPNYVDKIVTVTNTGKTPAYVRTLIAVPTGTVNEDPDDGIVSEQWLHFNVLSDTDTDPANGWYYGKNKAAGEYPAATDRYVLKNVEINGALYDVTVATNVNPLGADKTTGPSLVGLYLDNDVDYKDGKYYGKHSETGEPVVVWEKTEMEVLVLSQAVQSAGFDDAFLAFTNSFGEVTADTAKAWFEGITDADIKSSGADNVPPAAPTVTP